MLYKHLYPGANTKTEYQKRAERTPEGEIKVSWVVKPSSFRQFKKLANAPPKAIVPSYQELRNAHLTNSVSSATIQEGEGEEILKEGGGEGDTSRVPEEAKLPEAPPIPMKLVYE